MKKNHARVAAIILAVILLFGIAASSMLADDDDDGMPMSGKFGISVLNTDRNMGDYPTSGAVLEIYDGNDVLVDEVTTNEIGKAQSVFLEPGMYKLVQTAAPTGYVLNMEEKSVSMTVWGAKPIVIFQTPQTGVIRIHKYNANPSFGTPSLAGAVFVIQSRNEILKQDGSTIYYPGEIVDSVTTNENGEAISKPLPLGEYVFYENVFPEGFMRKIKTYETALEYAGQDTDVVYADVSVPQHPIPRMGTITIEKTGEMFTGVHTVETEFGTQYVPVYIQQPTEGQRFIIKAAEEIVLFDETIKAGEIVDTLTIVDGVATSRELYCGDYIIIEDYVEEPFTKSPLVYYVSLRPEESPEEVYEA